MPAPRHATFGVRRRWVVVRCLNDLLHFCFRELRMAAVAAKGKRPSLLPHLAPARLDQGDVATGVRIQAIEKTVCNSLGDGALNEPRHSRGDTDAGHAASRRTEEPSLGAQSNRVVNAKLE